MPYLVREGRVHVDEMSCPRDAGELNYAITRLCQWYLKETKGKYTDYNTIIGALESAKLEFYRRAVAVYEDTKIAENGDVY